jgi:dual specificity MAP kinase phosphatase
MYPSDIYIPIRILLEKYLFSFGNKYDISKITDNIYIGNLSTSNNYHVLENEGITHIISAMQYFSPSYPNKIKYLHVNSYDWEEYDISNHFQETNLFIREALQNNGKVYIHCLRGVSRSVSILIAHLMTLDEFYNNEFNVEENYKHILKYVQSKRSIALPNKQFEKQIIDFFKSVKRKKEKYK